MKNKTEKKIKTFDGRTERQIARAAVYDRIYVAYDIAKENPANEGKISRIIRATADAAECGIGQVRNALQRKGILC